MAIRPIEIPSAWQTQDPKTREDMRRLRVALELFSKQLLDLQAQIDANAAAAPTGDITAVTAGTGLTGGGTSGAVALAADFGTGAGKVTQGNDSRLSDSRAPNGSAGGDLGGTYPNPTVTQARGLRETAGPTTLAMGAVPALTILRRSSGSGNTVEGCVPGDFTHQASPTSSMKVMIDDGGVIKYCTISELLAVLGSVGKVLQMQYTASATTSTGGANMPATGGVLNNNAPTITDGNAHAALDTTITPINASSKLLVEVFLPLVSASGTCEWCGALFMDSTLVTAGTMSLSSVSAASEQQFKLRGVINAGSTSAKTFKFRYGDAVTGGSTLGVGQKGAATNILGGGCVAVMTVTEIGP